MSKNPQHKTLGTDIYDADKKHVGTSPFAPNAAMGYPMAGHIRKKGGHDFEGLTAILLMNATHFTAGLIDAQLALAVHTDAVVAFDHYDRKVTKAFDPDVGRRQIQPGSQSEAEGLVFNLADEIGYGRFQDVRGRRSAARLIPSALDEIERLLGLRAGQTELTASWCKLRRAGLAHEQAG